jgi:hypothetical protein
VQKALIHFEFIAITVHRPNDSIRVRDRCLSFQAPNCGGWQARISMWRSQHKDWCKAWCRKPILLWLLCGGPHLAVARWVASCSDPLACITQNAGTAIDFRVPDMRPRTFVDGFKLPCFFDNLETSPVLRCRCSSGPRCLLASGPPSLC